MASDGITAMKHKSEEDMVRILQADVLLVADFYENLGEEVEAVSEIEMK